MNSGVITTLIIIGIYLIAMGIIGSWPSRKAANTMEEYHMGSRQFKTFLLFCTVFGTNISAVALVGAPGQAYHQGWIVWPYYVTAWAWLTPLFFYFIGKRAWVLGRHHGVMTQADVVDTRWGSNTLSYLVSIIITLYSIPYIMLGSIGGGQVLSGLTGNAVPYWLGALIITAVVTFYVSFGGMKGTAWTNVVQVVIFMVGTFYIFFLMLQALGGPSGATQAILEKSPHLLSRSKLPWEIFFSFGILVPLAVPMFPQVFIRLLIASTPKELKRMILIYPLAGAFIWFLVSYIGMWGSILIPGLEGTQSEKIIPMFLAKYGSLFSIGILGAVLLAAAMSTMDAQLLTVDTMLVKDILSKRSTLKGKSESNRVWYSRMLIIVVAILAYILALIQPGSILNVFNWLIGGFASLMVVIIAALYWKRCTKEAAIASLVVPQVIVLGSWAGIIPKSINFGMLPGLLAVIIGVIVLIAVTYLTKPQSQNEAERFFSVFEDDLEKFENSIVPNEKM